jgi:hypothetical protein
MGTRVTVKQNNFSHGMQSQTRNKNLVGQTQVFGAERVKHFDIHKNENKLTPNPSFERFNTAGELELGIGAVGVKDDTTIIGLGKAINNWYSKDWDYRIELTPDSTGTVDYTFIDLSNLDSDFWSNINVTGSDIRVTSADEPSNTLEFRLEKFDSGTETGFVVIKKTDVENLYLYFGNTSAEAVTPNPLENRYEGFTSGYFYSMDGNTLDLGSTADLDSGTATYGNGRIGEGLISSSMTTVASSFSSGDSCSISAHLKTGATLAGSAFNVSIQNDLALKTNTSGEILIDVDTTGASNSNISTGSFVAINSEYYITVTYGGVSAKVFVNGSLVFTSPAYNNPLDSDNGQVSVSSGTQSGVEFVVIKRNVQKTDANSLLEGDMFSDATFYTQGTLELFTGITPSYSGVAIYEKDIAGTEWTNSTYRGEVIADRSAGVYPIPAFIEYNNGYFFLTATAINFDSFIYGARAGFDSTLIDSQDTLLSTRTKKTPLSNIELAIDNEYYFGLSGRLSNYDTAQFNSDVYDPFPNANSLVRYGYSLAITGTRDGQGSIEIWNTTATDPETVIATGTGINRVITNTSGSLVTVVDNYIQSPELSRGNPTLDFRLWNSQDDVRTLQSFPFDNVATVYANDWEFAIDSIRSEVQNASIFYAEPATGWTGLWGIGKSQGGSQLGVSIPYDTSDLGRIAYHKAIGNNLIIINSTGEMYKLNDDGDYTKESEFKSMIIDAGVSGITKDIVAMEIVLDKAPTGQTITLEYSTDGGTFETVGVCDGIVTEFTLASGASFNNFNELQLRITSVNGDASITEYSVKVEYEEEVV